jgi:hypothetical protein
MWWISAAIAALGLVASAPPGSTQPADSTTRTITLEDSCLPRETVPEHTAVLGGVTVDGAEWVTAFGVDWRGIQLVCVDIIYAGEPATTGVLGGPFNAAATDDEIVVSVLTTGPREGPRWLVLRGAVTADAERIELSIAGAEPIEAQLADAGPENDWRWFATVVPVADSMHPHVTATAYDADDEEIATGESPF